MLTILPSQPEDLGLITPPQKVINQNPDKLRITGTGFMGASVLAGLMYTYATLTQEKEKKHRDNAG